MASQSQEEAVLVPLTSGHLKCGLIKLRSSSHYPFFVAVTIDDEDYHIYRYLTDPNPNLHKLKCYGCQQTISNTSGQVNHTSLPHGAPCSGSSEVRPYAVGAICRWAAFHANLQAKAAGKDCFSREDWQDFMRSAGFGPVKELTDVNYQSLKTFIGHLEAEPDRLVELIGLVKAGEQLIERINNLPLWRNNLPSVQETASSTSLRYPTLPAQMATQSSPRGTSGTQHPSKTGSEIIASPGGRLNYGIFHSSGKTPNFVAVTLDPAISRIYRLCKRQGPRERPAWFFTCRACKMSISRVDSSVKHAECNSNQVQEAIQSIRQWATFRAVNEAKAAGRKTFTVEDWQRWMAVAGHSVENPSDEEFTKVMQFSEVLDALPTDRMDHLTTRAETGEALVRFTNQFDPWRPPSRGRKREAPVTFDEDYSSQIEARPAASPKTVSSLQMVLSESSGAGSRAPGTMDTRVTKRALVRQRLLTSESNTSLVQGSYLEELSEFVTDPAPVQSPVAKQRNAGGAHLAVHTPTLESLPASSNVDNEPIVVQGSNPVAEASPAAIPQDDGTPLVAVLSLEQIRNISGGSALTSRIVGFVQNYATHRGLRQDDLGIFLEGVSTYLSSTERQRESRRSTLLKVVHESGTSLYSVMKDLEAAEAKLTELLDQVKRLRARKKGLQILVDQKRAFDQKWEEELLANIVEKELEEFLNSYLSGQ